MGSPMKGSNLDPPHAARTPPQLTARIPLSSTNICWTPVKTSPDPSSSEHPGPGAPQPLPGTDVPRLSHLNSLRKGEGAWAGLGLGEQVSFPQSRNGGGVRWSGMCCHSLLLPRWEQ